MKNAILTLLLLGFVLFSKAQTTPYIAKLYKTDSIGADAIVKDIVASTGKAFKLNSRQSKNNTVVYFYEPVNKGGKDLMISLSTWNDGATAYKLKSVYGTFDDLYPFWKTNISSKLSADEIAKGIGDTYLLNPPSPIKKLRFKKYQDVTWSIDCM